MSLSIETEACCGLGAAGGVAARASEMSISASTTLTIRLTPEVQEQLGRLVDTTHRTESFPATEAVAKYVARETEIIEGIERGVADMKAGRLVPHDEAMARLEATIAAAERGKR